MPTVGEEFGRYRLDRVLGQGGMGIVFAATDLRLNRTVALKVITGVLAESPEFRARFQAEAASLARLDSPHVIAIHDHDEIDGTPYIVTQYVEGVDLWTQINEHGAMPAKQALQLCAQLARGLADAHRVGVIHRDVKPGNVLIRGAGTPDQHAYLCDFGIARADGVEGPAPTATGMVAGTWSYLSPDRTAGAPATPSSDIYALGCVLWACVTGREPYQGTDVQVALAHQQAPIPRLPGNGPFTDQLNAVVERALAKDPADRYTDASVFRADLERLAAIAPADTLDAPVAAPDGPTVVRPQPGGAAPTVIPGGRGSVPLRHRRWPLFVAAAAVLALLIGGITWLTLRNDDADGDDDRTAPGIAEDLDGDGHGDALVQQSRFDALSPLPSWTLASTGKLFQKAQRTASAIGTPARGDVDADGRPDIAWVEETSDEILAVHVEPGKGEPWDTEVRIDPDADLQDYSAQVGDVTGDGRSDIVLIGDAGDVDTIWVAVGRKDGFADPTPWYKSELAQGTILIGDFDGDDTDDVLYAADRDDVAVDADPEVDDIAGLVRVLVADDNGFTASKDLDLTNAALAPLVSDWSVGDVDGNGDDELVIVGASNTGIIVHDFVDGAFTAQKIWWSVSRTQEERREEYARDALADATVSDVDGDGDGDLVQLINTETEAFALSVRISDGSKFADAEDWGALACGTECEDSFDFID
ncbi:MULTISPECIES: protein kinase domain-containing protein [unclassified Nocardioides]|uniref:protein kinase domain-containing protein n=1 Tax=unclassified Nocardioides TaxID=2615069 RepID=UPI00138F35BA|nr:MULTISPECIES: protein kinase [unclassified Nocardioides]